MANNDRCQLLILAQRENCAVPNKKLFGSMMCHISLSKTLMYSVQYMYSYFYSLSSEALIHCFTDISINQKIL